MSTQHTDVIIGLEIHCQLNTQTKLFCGCSTDYKEDGPNTHVCPVCIGLPGAMPMVNKKAVEYALRVAKALNLEVLEESEFARKNYFYPDLPKGYQITMYDRPLAERGILEIEDDEGKEKKIRITRIHLEEDPGKLVHMGGVGRARYTLVDYNRSGIPLIEIVTEPDLRSPKEARRFLNKLRATLEYLGIFDGEREGALRVDANISIKGSERVEVKNITSYKGVEKALTFEITRQKSLIRRGAQVERETRHFQEGRGITTSARSKETETDYRYFPEPDLRPLRVQDWVAKIALPELPDARRDRFMSQYGLSLNHARTLTGDLRLAEFYEALAAKAEPVLAATWTADTLQGELNYRDMPVTTVPLDHFADLVNLAGAGEVTDRVAVDVLRKLLDAVLEGRSPAMPSAYVQEQNLGKGDASAFAAVVDEVIAENEQAVADYRAGKASALNFLLGQVMKKTRGKADPREITPMIAARISTEEGS
ncbi:Asp-tRNA(Asn)/Glu-tRNA(Gln) amidotransferase subunit GatB [Methanofollis aquaemaris]|uniref:Aspartyl/glutamyl-tRNA(Asn/Gln) amidotransferase subunit B n=1 Tax=Methanofollis aquaemaris TaxID=126734 RepID=A0A8A3S7Y7_9EURY|nr:Asp-tRNA(Asn)/Glu-tRNA(Gln) amidotransferase subunit GatB [Methanofollis aquaemaris]QSZ68043.1 Asp-tRNA(Asn)/Glu-tRNA(Gln) amidotransferase subunit GatB [Methanofollis aquaemaris]